MEKPFRPTCYYNMLYYMVQRYLPRSTPTKNVISHFVTHSLALLATSWCVLDVSSYGRLLMCHVSSELLH